jgi:hypothetical protein
MVYKDHSYDACWFIVEAVNRMLVMYTLIIASGQITSIIRFPSVLKAKTGHRISLSGTTPG